MKKPLQINAQGNDIKPNDSQGASMTSPRARARVCGTCKNAQARRGDYIVCKLLPVHEWRAGTLACKFSPERWVAI